MKNARLFWILMLTALLVLVSGQALAQFEGESGHSHSEDPTTTPLIVPAIEDFAPPPGGEVGVDGQPVVVAPVGVTSYFEFSEKNKVLNFTPRYRFNESFALKVRLPWIAERSITYWGGEVSASGIGDIAIEGQYSHQFANPGQVLRLQGTVKLPTGDDENIEEHDGNSVGVPLGTGSLDFMGRMQYSRSTVKTGLLASIMFRKNTAAETTYDYEGSYLVSETYKNTNGNEFVLSLFGRYMISPRWWLNLGASANFMGDGTSEYTSVDNTENTTTTESDLLQKRTLVDLYPGISYDLGVITPYLGARIPLATNYDLDGVDEDRDTVFLLQFTYRPLKMVD